MGVRWRMSYPFEPASSPYLVPFDGAFRVGEAESVPPGKAPGHKRAKEGLAEQVEALDDLQRRLYADDRFSLLLVFQAMDAAGEFLSYDDIELQIIKKEYYMSIFSDIFDKIMGKIKSLVPGANTISDVNLAAEFDKLAGKELEWRTSVVDFLKMIGANSSRENRDALAKELGIDASFKSGSAEKNEALRKALFKKIAENGGKIPVSLLD